VISNPAHESKEWVDEERYPEKGREGRGGYLSSI
jgi:hypothetical protein